MRHVLAASAFALWVAMTASPARAAGTVALPDSCAAYDPRAYQITGICKIPNIGQAECQRMGFSPMWFPGVAGGPGYCEFWTPAPNRGGAIGRNGMPTLPTIPSIPGGRPNGAAATLGALGNLAGAVANFANAWNGLFGRDPRRDGDLVPGGTAPITARADDLLALQYLQSGLALEQAALVDAAAEAYARAFAAAQDAGDEPLMTEIRARQVDLECANAMSNVLNTGQNPPDRLQRFQDLRATCGQGRLGQVLEALIQVQQDNLPPTASAAPGSIGDRLRRRLARADALDPEQIESGSWQAGLPAYGAAPAATPVDAQVQPGDDALAQARSDQDSRRRIFCSATADADNCLHNASYCLGAFASDRQKLDECSRAFHDPDIWYDAMKDFYVDPEGTRREIDRLTATFNDEAR